MLWWRRAILIMVAMVLIILNFSYKHGRPVEIKLKNEYWGPGPSRFYSKDIIPFKINVQKEVIDDLHKQLDRALSPKRGFVEPFEGVAWSYGVPSTYLKTVLEYWRNKYDWEERQALLNMYPQFKTKIQGLDIHFYHVKPRQPKYRTLRVLPLLMVHGWPGSVVEFQKSIPLLTQPKSRRDFMFELVIPSLPGFGFSDPAARPGLSPAKMAVIFKNLMRRLGFEKFYVQGGDWGSVITSNMGSLYPERVIGVHNNLCMVESARSYFLSLFGVFNPTFVIDMKLWSKMYPLTQNFGWLIKESGYLLIQATKPDTVGVGLSDSPAGLAAYILEKFSTWTNPANEHREDGGLLEKFTMNELLDNLMIYWVTNSITTSQRIYAEHFNKATRELAVEGLPITVPSACCIFPHDLFYQSETIVRERYSNLIQFTHPPRGGHFGAFEEPELLTNDLSIFVHKVERINMKKNSQ